MLEKLILEHVQVVNIKANVPVDSIVLTDQEARDLAEQLDEFIASKRFILATHFAEGLCSKHASVDIKEIYLSSRSDNGRSRVLSSKLWADFVTRFGGDRFRGWGSTVYKMPPNYFHKMERRLLYAAGLHPHVVQLVLDAILLQNDEIEAIRAGKSELAHGIIKAAVSAPVKKLRSPISVMRENEISAAQVAGAIAIVADLSVMFTTRDWSVAGTISTMAGALSATFIKDRKAGG